MVKELPIGSLINNRYKIERILGKGGFGRTYLVINVDLDDEKFVIKQLHINTDDPKLERLFKQEAKVLYKLDHPQIPKFRDWFKEGEQFFLVQDYIEGKTYKELLDRGHKLSEIEAIQWLRDILSVLNYLHSQNIIHRDISPDNIMFSTQTGKPMLIDFGVVKQISTQGNLNNIKQGTIVGKEGYSPPEQIRTGRCYPNSDLYALGVTTLVLLTKKKPHELFDSYSMKWSWQEYVNLSDKFAQILERCLAEVPEYRYQSAQEVLSEIEKLSPSLQASQPQIVAVASNTAITQPTLELVIQNSLNNWVSKIASQQTITTLSQLPVVTVVSKVPAKIGIKSKKAQMYAFSALLAIILGIPIVTISSPHVTVLCKIFANCYRDRQFQEIYLQSKKIAIEALNEADVAQNAEDLKDYRDRLEEAIDRIKTIPLDAKIYSEVQPILTQYQDNLTQINDRLQKEERAQQKLAEIEKLSTELIHETETAITLEEYQQIQARWERIQQSLSQVPEEVFVADRIKERKKQYYEIVKEVEDKIDRLVAEEAIRQEQAAKEAAAQAAANWYKTDITNNKISKPKPKPSSSPKPSPFSNSSPTPSPSPKTQSNSGQKSTTKELPPPGPPLWGPGSSESPTPSDSSNQEPQPLW
jgi:serine/threonine-protein kinase